MKMGSCKNLKQKLRQMAKRIKIAGLDLNNKIRYGLSAPLYAERIWINPQVIEYYYTGIDGYSGRVVKNWPPKKANKGKKISKEHRLNSCIKHWVYGLPWQDTPDYEKQLKKLSKNGIAWDADCLDENDVINKFKKLDLLYTQVKKEGNLKTRKTINPKNFREEGTFLIHIGPKGELYLGGRGYHRFAIARILNLKSVPASVGCVHQNAIPLLADLRKKKAT